MTENDFISAVKRNNQRLFLIALSFTKNVDDSEDIIQSVFERLWKYNKPFENTEHIDKWLTAVCVNESKNSVSAFFRKNHESLDSVIDYGTFDSYDDSDLFNSVMKLPKKERIVIHLFYYEDMSIKDISETLNIKESAVKTRLHRARRNLKEMLGDERLYE